MSRKMVFGVGPHVYGVLGRDFANRRHGTEPHESLELQRNYRLVRLPPGNASTASVGGLYCCDTGRIRAQCD